MKIAFVLLILIWMGLFRVVMAQENHSARPSREMYLRLAEDIRANLQNEILDHFFPVSADETHGGFFENYALDWTRGKVGDKSIVYQSRLTWTSAEAARRFPEQAAMYTAMTRLGLKCLAETMWDPESGGYFWSVGPDGKPTSDIKQLYGNSFGIYASAASYRATNDAAALDLAKRGFDWLEHHFHDDRNGGYFDAIAPDGKPISAGKSIVGARVGQKSMNSSIHILEALTELYRVWPDPVVKQRFTEMLDICRDKIYAEPGYLTQYLTVDWQRTTSPDSFGHDVETAYLMTEAAEALGQGDDPRIWNSARRLVDHAMQYGWDDQRGGLYDSAVIDSDGIVTGQVKTEKIWWVEAEHLNALLLLHEHYRTEGRYWEAFLKQWHWITQHQIDHDHGGWWPTVKADGTPASSVKANMWTECYHQARAMMSVSERLKKLAGQER